jgi:hypothetical protein
MGASCGHPRVWKMESNCSAGRPREVGAELGRGGRCRASCGPAWVPAERASRLPSGAARPGPPPVGCHRGQLTRECATLEPASGREACNCRQFNASVSGAGRRYPRSPANGAFKGSRYPRSPANGAHEPASVPRSGHCWVEAPNWRLSRPRASPCPPWLRASTCSGQDRGSQPHSGQDFSSPA